MGNYRIVGWGGPCNCPASHILLSRGWLGEWAAGCLCGCLCGQGSEYIKHLLNQHPQAECSTLGRGGDSLWDILLLSTQHPLFSSLHLPTTLCFFSQTSQRVKDQGQTWNSWTVETINFSSTHLEPLNDQDAPDRSKSHHSSQPYVLPLASTHMTLILPRLVLEINAQGKYTFLPTHLEKMQFHKI